jgi:integrase
MGEDADSDIVDRAYTHDEIKQMLDVSESRLRICILLMSSSGIRVGAIPTLLVGHLTKIPQYSLYKIKVYAGNKKSRYYTFCTPECAKEIDKYLDYRKRSGEHITDKSPLLRQQFDSNDVFQAANMIKPVNRHTIKRQIWSNLYRSGLRTQITADQGTKRDVSMCHGYRKFFNTALMNSDVTHEFKEMMMGHSVKLDDVYYDESNERSKAKLLSEYLKAADLLTINEENRLRRENQILKKKNDRLDDLEQKLIQLADQLGSDYYKG